MRTVDKKEAFLHQAACQFALRPIRAYARDGETVFEYDTDKVCVRNAKDLWDALHPAVTNNNQESTKE